MRGGSPQGSYWGFLEYGRRATLVGEVDGVQVGFDLRIVGHGDASASSRRTVKTISSIGAGISAAPVGNSNSAGTCLASAPAASSGTSRATVSLHRQRASRRIHEIQSLFSRCGHTRLKQRVRARPHCYAYLHRRSVSSIASVSTISAIGAVAAVSARRRIIRIGGTHAAGRAGHSVAAVRTIGTFGAGKIRDEVVVVGDGNIEFGVEIRVAGYGDGDVRCLSVADSRIMGENQDAFFVHGNYRRGHRKVAPQNFAFALPFGD